MNQIHEKQDTITCDGAVTNEQNVRFKIEDEISYAVNIDQDLSELSSKINESGCTNEIEDEVLWQTAKWKLEKKHIFVLSTAGKPIYSRHGNEDDLVTLFGVMQAIVSVVSDSQDEIQSIHTSNTHFIFLRTEYLLLVSVSHTSSDSDIVMRQLNYVYNQIVSILTLSQLTRIFKQYNNFDLRKLLSGSERLINNFIDFTENNAGFFLKGIECLPLNSSVRDSITQAITSSCNKIKNLLFAVLLTEKQLVILIRMKKYSLLPSDLHLLLNLINSNQSFKTAEGSWTPICLPNFDPSGYLQAHISYLSDECDACLILLTIDRESFFTLSEAKKKIVEKIEKDNILQEISSAVKNSCISSSEFCVPKLRHFIYKNKSTNQYVFPHYEVPYQKVEQQSALLLLYSQLYQHMNNINRPLKLVFQQLKTEAILGWDTKGFQLYSIFEPFITKQETIVAVNKLLKCMKKEEDRLFINNYATF